MPLPNKLAIDTAIPPLVRERSIKAANLRQMSRRCIDPLSGTLRIGVIPTISPYWLPELTPALHKAYPQLTVIWLEDKTHTLVHALQTVILVLSYSGRNEIVRMVRRLSAEVREGKYDPAEIDESIVRSY